MKDIFFKEGLISDDSQSLIAGTDVLFFNFLGDGGVGTAFAVVLLA